MARISQIWAQSVSDFVAVQHSDFTPDAAGYAAAEAYLVANGGGVLYVGAGLEALAVAPPANVIVVRMRASSVTGMELWGNLILPAGFSIRATDSSGTRRSILTPILDALNGDTVRIAYMNAVKGLLLTDHNAVEKARLTASRLSLGAGVDFAPNGLPGVLGQLFLSRGPAAPPGWLGGGALNNVLTHQGPGVDPAWVAPAAGGTKYLEFPVSRWDSGATLHTVGAVPSYFFLSLGGNADTPNFMLWRVPGDYNATTGWDVSFTSTGGFGLGVDWQLSMAQYVDGLAFNTLAFTDGAVGTVLAPAASETLKIGAIPTPAFALTPGMKVWLKITSKGLGDANNSARNLISVGLAYT